MAKLKNCLAVVVAMCYIAPMVLGQSLKNFEHEFIEIVKKIRASVVSIEISHDLQDHCRVSSGVLLDKAGHIVTVANTLRASKKIMVKLESLEQYEARLVGIDCKTNLAILKIDAPQLQPVAKGYSQDLQVGALLIIVGNPYGLTKSASYGIVSGVDRAVWMADANSPLTGLIQTTAPINPGDAGGLVVDSQGRFVGIASSTLSRNLLICGYQQLALRKLFTLLKENLQQENIPESEMVRMAEMLQNLPGNSLVSQGINFILPSHTIYWVAEQIIQYGEVRRGWIGVDVKDCENGQGVVVTNIIAKSPAANHDIHLEDRFLAIDGQEIPHSLFLLHKISYMMIGQEVCFTVARDAQTLQIRLRLEKSPEK
jgi:S1-C subfamily serine protease